MIDTAQLTMADLGKTVYVPVVLRADQLPPYRVWKQARIVDVNPCMIVFTVDGAQYFAEPEQCVWHPPAESMIL